ncbi:hypothetical protein M3Y95_00976600 [Aphelenchoides besseyi]|nr:hypothetical protein M3Y95_00976600 [Aphelenchoides besseyi]
MTASVSSKKEKLFKRLFFKTNRNYQGDRKARPLCVQANSTLNTLRVLKCLHYQEDRFTRRLFVKMNSPLSTLLLSVSSKKEISQNGYEQHSQHTSGAGNSLIFKRFKPAVREDGQHTQHTSGVWGLINRQEIFTAAVREDEQHSQTHFWCWSANIAMKWNQARYGQHTQHTSGVWGLINRQEIFTAAVREALSNTLLVLECQYCDEVESSPLFVKSVSSKKENLFKRLFFKTNSTLSNTLFVFWVLTPPRKLKQGRCSLRRTASSQHTSSVWGLINPQAIQARYEQQVLNTLLVFWSTHQSGSDFKAAVREDEQQVLNTLLVFGDSLILKRFKPAVREDEQQTLNTLLVFGDSLILKRFKPAVREDEQQTLNTLLVLGTHQSPRDSSPLFVKTDSTLNTLLVFGGSLIVKRFSLPLFVKTNSTLSTHFSCWSVYTTKIIDSSPLFVKANSTLRTLLMLE